MASSEAAFHRKVQNRLADRYLEPLEVKGEAGLETKRSEDASDGKEKRKTRERFASFTFQNILWLVGSLAVFHFTEFHKVVLYDPRINRFWFNAGAGLVGVTITVAFFLIVWKTFIKKRTPDDWEKDHPAAIPVATASFIIGSFCLLKGLWPVWGLLTPFILVTMFMGFVVLVAMIG
jgi:hypothetical protein